MQTSDKTTIHVKMSKADKKRAKEAADAIGMPLGTIANSLLKQFSYDRELYLRAAEVPNAATTKRLKKAREDARAGKNISPKFSNAEEAIAWLKR